MDPCQGPGTEPKRTDQSPVAERTTKPQVQRSERSGSGKDHAVQPERPENTGDCAGAKAQEKQEIPEDIPENPEDIPGQTELTEDFPEYCPTMTRKAYIGTLSPQEAAEYISGEYVKHKLHTGILAFPNKIQEWLEKTVDIKGKEVQK